jgi:Asp-tRNA(Asn)/Glu-tRNA(Gln) amidotransferase A subunit family amidase
MPIGLQLVGPEFSDLILIDVARLLRDECGYGFRPPPAPFGFDRLTDSRTSKL